MRSLLLPALLVLALSGCVDSVPVVTPEPTVSATPVFASEEEALAAAVEAYAAYSAVEDAIARDGGADPERLAPLVSPEWLAHEVEVFEAFQESGNKQIGSTSIESSQLQRYSDFEVVLYVCVDFSSTSFVDSSGNAIPPGDSRSATVEAAFEIVGSDLILVGSEPWSESIC